ncbi:MAG TPA: Gfo/Idh/MocA family oxidoreductase [Cyclobacteriaceae bacterium]|nr:Gfo/Idh/MocA family oxidoreductase [Cyclobacteriaceae bacterium]
MKKIRNLNRREFLGTAASIAAFTVVPRHVIGGRGYVAPNDKITLGYIGCGTQGLREMVRLVSNPDVQIVAACDPENDNTNYIDWSPTGIRNSIREVLEEPSWGEGVKGIRAGRAVAKEVVEKYYAKKRSAEKFNGCSSYTDFKELLDKEKDLDAVKIMTPDHLHATISIAAMKKGKHVIMHKPLANRVYEARLVAQTARTTGVVTHLLAWRRSNDELRKMILSGAIGTLKEIHNWTDRPYWPQYSRIPTEQVPVPPSFDWDMWLGPVPDRPYHPHYTHAVFRGWYDFGAGSIADMGNYSLWPVFDSLGLGIPESVEALPCGYSEIADQISKIYPNDFSFPNACIVKFKLPASGELPPLDLYWYDGGMRPMTPDELRPDKKAMPATGLMFVGDKGKILGDQIIPEKKMFEYLGVSQLPEREQQRRGNADAVWVEAIKTGKQSPGSFNNVANVTETICLAGAALRFSRKNFKAETTTPPLEWDAQAMKFTNMPDADKYLVREYRSGWEL